MYLDPGFGGSLLQIVVVLAVAGGAILFSIRRKIRNMFSREQVNATSADNYLSNTEAKDDVVDVLGEQ